MASPDAAWKILISIANHLNCWIDARRRDEPPDDFAGRFAGRFDGDVKVVDSQRASVALPQAAGDGSSGVTSDRESFAFIFAPAGCVGGVPLTRARNPWAMPDAT